MDREEIREAVLAIIADIAPDEDFDSLKDDEPLRDQLGLDSMDFLDIVMELRKQHKVEVPEDDYKELISLTSTVNYLEGKM
jgi:acyl carrier protein